MDNQVHWVNNFWGQDDAGYRKLMERMHQAKRTCDELKLYYRERLAIEQEYSKKLTALSRRALGSNETGGMKQSLEAVRSTTKSTALTHETVARQLSEQLLAPLDAFTSSMRGRSKTVEETMSQLTKAKASQNNSSEKAKNRYIGECNKISGYQAQQNLLMGRELDKNNQKLDRAMYQVEGLQRQYQDSLKALAQVMENWNSEWRLSCDKLEQIEEERLTFIKSNLWAYANALSAACVADDEACETVRVTLEHCEPTKDLENFSRENGTGSKIQDPPEFVSFLQGFSRDNDDEGGHYHVANFNSSLNDGDIPDLGISDSPSLASSSPNTNQFNFTPMSSPGTTQLPFDEQASYGQQKLLNQQQSQNVAKQSTVPSLAQSSGTSSALEAVPPIKDVKKRRSWAMPFKRKSNVDTSGMKYVSALDQPGTSLDSSSTFSTIPPPPSMQPASDSRRQSWAPGSVRGTNSYSNLNGPDQTAGALQPTDTKTEDPLLTALERLKTPDLKARPKSMGYMNSGPPNGMPIGSSSSPYGNGSRADLSAPRATAAPGSPQHNGTSASPRRKPVRKQVGQSEGLPTTTSDGRKVIKHCRAQYDYRAAIPEEVTFRKGDILLITEMQEDGWWDSEVAGRAVFGLAPSNFLADAH